jgi:hypothetical protein
MFKQVGNLNLDKRNLYHSYKDYSKKLIKPPKKKKVSLPITSIGYDDGESQNIGTPGI